MKTTHSHDRGRQKPPSRGDLLDCLLREYPLVIRFVMKLGVDAAEAEAFVQSAYAEIWSDLIARRKNCSSIVELEKHVRICAYKKYMRPPAARRPLPRVLARTLDKSNADPTVNTAELTLGTFFVLRAWHSLDTLPRSALAFDQEGFQIPEIAAQLGITDDLAAGALLQARGAMRKELSGCKV